MAELAKNNTHLDIFSLIGYGFILLGIVILVWIYYPAGKEELEYAVKSTREDKASEQAPINTDFSIQIPAIYADAPVIADVDPLDPSVYEYALSHGVAHSLNTGKPGGDKNIFLFAHSSSSFQLATRYNSVFYLLHKLHPGDAISLWYQDNQYHYHVTSIGYVKSSDTSLINPTNGKTLILMTCWPPGTTIKRLIVKAELDS